MIFNDLFIFEMANNHQGSINHGKRIIDKMSELTRKYNLNSAVKLQFRHYDTFIHPNMINDKDNPKVKRFLSTRLSDDEHEELCKYIRSKGMYVMVTPFDELSVELTRKCDVDILKVGSPSLFDFKLLEKISAEYKPLIFSSGGCDLDHIDKIYNFFKHRNNEFALMHCVSIYPTPPDQLNLNTITTFKRRYPDITIGFSTHEEPINCDAIKIAYSLGARIYEKHIGVETEEIKLNKYSTNPVQTENWIKSLLITKESIGESRIISETEKNDLNLLYRGIYINKELKEGEEIKESDIYFAFPKHKDGVLTGDINFPIIASKDYKENDHIHFIEIPKQRRDKAKDILISYNHKVKGLLNESSIKLPLGVKMELSHHYGREYIFNNGCFIATIFNNDEYSKKIIVLLPNQSHPEHYHKKKDETFIIMKGELRVNLSSHLKILKEGDILRIPRLTKHSFETNNGCIFEEISTTHFDDDSFYTNREISSIERNKRKTKLINWVITN